MISRGQISFALHGWRSACALVCCSVAWLASLGAIVGSMVLYAQDGVSVLELFEYFTTITNTITTLGAGMLFPFAVEGFRRKNFSCPRWATMFFYSGTICSTLTMLFATLIISQLDPVMAFGGYNLYLHVICPFLTISTFFLVESDSAYSRRDSILCTMPVVIYSVLYLIEVIHIGAERGGWEDLYHLTRLAPPVLTIALVDLLAFGLAELIRISHRHVCDARRRRFMRTTIGEGMSEVEVRIGMLEYGELVGRHEDENFVVLPLKTISLVASRYTLRREELAEIYTRALIDTMDERRERDKE